MAAASAFTLVALTFVVAGPACGAAHLPGEKQSADSVPNLLAATHLPDSTRLTRLQTTYQTPNNLPDSKRLTRLQTANFDPVHVPKHSSVLSPSLTGDAPAARFAIAN
eukprot:1926204-Rhodomonas_salina.2